MVLLGGKMALLINGKEIAEQIKNELRLEVKALEKQGKTISLAVIQVGANPASSVYVQNKKKACEYIGIESLSYELEESTTQEQLLELIDELNTTDKVRGILVQLPLPKHINEEHIIRAILPSKDVDAFHPTTIGNVFVGGAGFMPCTPAGIVELIKRSNIQIAGKECVVLGRSNNVGKPTALLMVQENATVTIAHSKTANLKKVTKRADILIVAMGQPNFVTKEYVKSGAVIIDVGIHRNEQNRLCGDVDFEDVKEIASAITPVPGGVGPMTVAMLMKNCLKAI